MARSARRATRRCRRLSSARCSSISRISSATTARRSMLATRACRRSARGRKPLATGAIAARSVASTRGPSCIASCARRRSRPKPLSAAKLPGRGGHELEDVQKQPDRDAVRQLAEQLENQLALLDTARISTLHSFCLELVRAHFYQLAIDPEVTVLDEQQTQPLIERTLDALFERAYAGEDPPSTAARELVRAHGHGSDAPIRALLVKVHRYAQSLANPDAWFDEQRRHLAEAEPGPWRGWLRDGFDEWRSLLLPILEEFGGTPAGCFCVAGPKENPGQT